MQSVTRIEAAAVFDDAHGRVEIGGQLFAGDAPVSGLDVEIEVAWGAGCRVRSSTLGSFAAWFHTSGDALGSDVAVRAGGYSRTLTVR
jgi:hypothetical protein